jgi:hypothetical protein
MNIELSSNETILSGKWISQNGSVVADDVSRRIENLTQSALKEIATSDDGWSTLYMDPADGRYWELYYDDSDSHAGGAPTLKHLPNPEAKKKYTF